MSFLSMLKKDPNKKFLLIVNMCKEDRLCPGFNELAKNVILSFKDCAVCTLMTLLGVFCWSLIAYIFTEYTYLHIEPSSEVQCDGIMGKIVCGLLTSFFFMCYVGLMILTYFESKHKLKHFIIWNIFSIIIFLIAYNIKRIGFFTESYILTGWNCTYIHERNDYSDGCIGPGISTILVFILSLIFFPSASYLIYIGMISCRNYLQERIEVIDLEMAKVDN